MITLSSRSGSDFGLNMEGVTIDIVYDAALRNVTSLALRRDPQGRVGTHYPLHSLRSNRNTEVVTKRLRVDAHFKGNITSTQCFESSRIEKR